MRNVAVTRRICTTDAFGRWTSRGALLHRHETSSATLDPNLAKHPEGGVPFERGRQNRRWSLPENAHGRKVFPGPARRRLLR